MEKIIIKTKNFLIKSLVAEDVTENYLNWFKDQTVKKFITSFEYKDIDSLKKYVNEQSNKKNVIFLGIFTYEGLHIGNIKFENIDRKKFSATLGILIGDKNFRGKGVAVEVINACISWFFYNLSVSRFFLGVDKCNLFAIKAYKKSGFKEYMSSNNFSKKNKSLFMIRDYSNIQRIAIGAAQFGMNYGIANNTGQTSFSELSKILNSAQKLGINTIDTATSYGESENMLGKFGVENWQVVSKLSSINKLANIENFVQKSLESSLNKLKLKSLYGLLIHKPEDLLSNYGKNIFKAIQKLKEKGLIKKIGVSIYDIKDIDLIIPKFQIDLIQAPFNIIDQRLKTSGWLQKIKDSNIELHTRSAFLQGLLLMNKNLRPNKFDRWQQIWNNWEKFLKDSGKEPHEICLGFVLSNPEIDKVILGFDNLNQLTKVLKPINPIKLKLPPNILSNDMNLINPSMWEKL